ncbi:MAG: Na+/H+ antiporter NhaC family protein [Clostridia bacterium]|nr:Na+/H+ antiporter NhaC family protein [Clostridia bacterium]
MTKVNKKRNLVTLLLFAAFIVLMVVAALTTNAESVQQSFWALVPPIVAISLALATKEVYSSLFVGVLAGGLLYSGFNFEGTINHIFSGNYEVDGEEVSYGIINVLSDSYNVGILIFLVILGAMVALMNRAGGSAAFGRWAATHIKSRVGVMLSTILLGALIFIDDYFNCLTVGSVMKPVTDKQKISRSKLAYLIDSTAAPICIIAPISSWAAAVSGFVEGENGMALFLKAIPFNFYALLTIVMMVAMVLMKVDYGPMAKHEANALNGDIYSGERVVEEGDEDVKDNGKVIDLVFPIVTLIICCIIGMIYTGGFFSGTDFITAFSECDAPLGLVFGSFVAMVLTIIFYLIRNVLNFSDCMACLPKGFKAMVPAILILTLAWSLKSMTDSLGAAEYVAGLVESSAAGFMNFLPAIIFLIAVGLSFATGTSWGTFGILIPIVVSAFQTVDYQLMIVAISACMAGAVCGDHCSPISDTTIMASAGAECNHVNHVSTQLPYALTCAAVSFVVYIIAGFTTSAVISLPIGIALMVGTLVIIKLATKKKA